MSLTYFINNRKFQPLRDRFKSDFHRQAILLDAPLIAPQLTSNYSVVGQAFDYLMRFMLEHKNIDKWHWIITERIMQHFILGIKY